jgi:hypothetical protein
MKAFRKVGRQIVQLRRDLKAAVKELNNDAARKVGQGNYAASQEMIGLAKTVQQFGVEAKEMDERWKAIRKQRATRPVAEKTPGWEYYRLVANALASLGADSSFDAVADWIKKNALSELRPGDLLDGPKGEPVWLRALRRAKRPMIKEGFLEAGGGTWRLTKSGRNLASQRAH